MPRTPVDKPEYSGSLGSQLANVPGVVRDRVIRGETKLERRQRLAREVHLERLREQEHRRDFTGRVYPVRYDDETD
jgi:hypothetical protein